MGQGRRGNKGPGQGIYPGFMAGSAFFSVRSQEFRLPDLAGFLSGTQFPNCPVGPGSFQSWHLVFVKVAGAWADWSGLASGRAARCLVESGPEGPNLGAFLHSRATVPQDLQLTPRVFLGTSPPSSAPPPSGKGGPRAWGAR